MIGRTEGVCLGRDNGFKDMKYGFETDLHTTINSCTRRRDRKTAPAMMVDGYDVVSQLKTTKCY